MAEFAVAICVGISAGVVWLFHYILGFGWLGFSLLGVPAAVLIVHMVLGMRVARRCLKSVKGMKQERLIRYYFGQFTPLYNASYVISTSVYEILLCANQSMKFYKISKETVENGLAKRGDDYFFRTILSWNKFLASVRFNVFYRKRQAECTNVLLMNEKIRESVENPQDYEAYEERVSQWREGVNRLTMRAVGKLDEEKQIAYLYRRNLVKVDKLKRKCAPYEEKILQFYKTVAAVESDIKQISRKSKVS